MEKGLIRSDIGRLWDMVWIRDRIVRMGEKVWRRKEG